MELKDLESFTTHKIFSTPLQNEYEYKIIRHPEFQEEVCVRK